MNDVLDRALQFAIRAHKGQLRKDGTPFILHPLEDAAIVATLTLDPAVLAAAVLHDTVEDTAVTPEEIREAFGERIYELVMHETENKRPDVPPEATWQVRKEESLQVLADADDPAVLMLWLGDKLSNLRALARGHEMFGKDVFLRFNNRDPLAHKWYFGTILQLLSPLADTSAYREYSAIYHMIFDRYKGE